DYYCYSTDSSGALF
nr:immunoglobulin light chain junction region [Macaca mulatta]MOW60428.1 immunoglobulin light chain junction region [Macaca mulatta]